MIMCTVSPTGSRVRSGRIHCAFLDLSDERLASLELSKGKLTIEPRRHSGEGVFFTSRVRPVPDSGGELLFDHDHAQADDLPCDLAPRYMHHGTTAPRS